MKLPRIFLTLLLTTLLGIAHSQEWRLYTASDAVRNFVRYQNDIWTISGSGLTKVDMQTSETQTWNTINSDLPDYACDIISVDSSGTIWLGLSDNYNGSGIPSSKLIRFDGSNFETITDINGIEIHNVSGIETTPDGKVWIYASTSNTSLFSYEQGAFLQIPLPSSDFTYGNSAANFGLDAQSHVWTVLINTASDKAMVGEFDGSQWTLHDLSAFGQEPDPNVAWAHDLLGNVYLLIKGHISPNQLIQYNGQQWNEINLPSIGDAARYIDHPLFVDSDNQLWLSLSDNSLQYYNGITWNEFYPHNFGLNNGQPDKFYINDQGHWWIMYDHYDDSYSTRSLYRYDGTSTQQVDLSNSSLPSNHVNDIMVDELNNKWFSTIRSLVKFDGGTWVTIHAPDESTYPWPIGSNRTGGVWLFPYENYISLFDGVTFSKIFPEDTNGVPLDIFGGYKADALGRLLVTTGSPNVFVYDHGQTVFLDSIFYESSQGELRPDHAYDVATDASGQIYAVGSGLHRLKPDSTWTNIRLWDSNAFGYKVFVAPDEKIWVLDVNSIPFENKYWIYDGTQWTEAESAYQFSWEPKWDLSGTPWFLSEAGLCKYENETWHCYDRSNSPLIPERLNGFAIDSYNNFWVSLEDGGLLVFNEDHIEHINGQESPLLSGHIYRDLNHNGIMDTTDTPLASQRSLLLPESTIAYSNATGLFRLATSSGDHEVKYLPRPNWHIDNSPSSYNVTVGTDSISDLDFNLVPDQEITDLQMYLNEGFPRCGQWSTYWISFNNFGTISASGEITFIKDPDTELGAINPMPYWISGDTIKWTFTDVIPFASGQYSVELFIPASPGSFLEWRGYLDLVLNDSYQRVDSFYTQQEIRCAYDPNDKIARSVRTAGDGKSYLEDPLLYTIRFQNTGNDTAFNVIIRDTLDGDLELNTLEIISASHPYQAFLKTDRTLEFRFINIQLPDSTINEMASHGFVTYSIKAKTDVTSPAIIANTAHIYFDFNQAVRTNTAINELVEVGTGTYDDLKLVSLLRAYPNPLSDELMIEALSKDCGPIDITLFSPQGRALQSGKLYPGTVKQLSLASYPQGIYILRAAIGQAQQSIVLVKG